LRRRRKKAETEPDAEKPRGGKEATAAVTAITGALIAAYLFWTNPHWSSYETYKLVNTALCLWLPLLVIILGLRQEPSQFGLTRGDQRLGLKLFLAAWVAMLPVLYFASRQPVFQHQYLTGRLHQWMVDFGPVFDGRRVSFPALFYYELGMGFYMFCWEFFFRGFLLFGLIKTRLGPWGGIILQALPFMLLHWSPVPGASKPYLEVLSALPGGIILGILAWRTRSFLYGFLIHWAISLTLDLFLLIPFIFRQIG